MSRERRQERDRRSGRTWAAAAAGSPAASSPPSPEVAAALTAHLHRLRTALADRSTARELIDVQRDQAELERALGEAIAHAFAADARGWPLPDGVTSWVAEGLARSHERERLLLDRSVPHA
jgi:hypothetical protein